MKDDKEQNNSILSLIKNLSELSEEKSDIIKELTSIIKIINTRLSALEITVQYLEKKMVTDTERASFLELIHNLQKQVDILIKTIYEKDE